MSGAPNTQTLTLDALAANTALPSGSLLTGASVNLALSYSIAGFSAKVSNTFPTVSPGNSLGLTGGDGVAVEQSSFAAIVGNTIQQNPGAGVAVRDSSTARIGFNNDSDVAATGNTIFNNGFGIALANRASARIAGNSIQNNFADGVTVSRDSQADLSANSIGNNFGNAVVVQENSQVQFGADTGTGLFEAANSGGGNGGVGVLCAHGGVLDGRLGGLAGDGGQTAFLDGSCLDSLQP